jgi:hypothetical protein
LKVFALIVLPDVLSDFMELEALVSPYAILNKTIPMDNRPAAPPKIGQNRPDRTDIKA